MAAMVAAHRRLIISLAGQHLQAGGKHQTVISLQDLSAELAWNVLFWTRVGPDPSFLSSKINMPADQCSP